MSSAEEGWDVLTVRLQHLTHLTNRTREFDGIEDIVYSFLKPVAMYVLAISQSY
jgi:hypothetical protein